MQSFIDLAKELEKLVNEDIERIVEVCPSVHEHTDNIKLNVAGQLSAMSCLIEDKIRLREIKIKDQNKFQKVDQEIVVFVMGSVKHPNTNRVKSRFSVVWGSQHQINVVRDNILSIKTRNNSTLLAVLACLNQAVPLKFKKLCLMMNNPKVKNLLDSIDLINIQGFKNEDGNLIEDHELLKMIYAIVSEHCIQLNVKLAVPEPPYDEIFYEFQQAARALIDGQ